MSRPSQLPEWSTSGTNTEPTTEKKAKGWTGNEKPPGFTLNWWQNLVYQWVKFGDDTLGIGQFGDGSHGDSTLSDGMVHQLVKNTHFKNLTLSNGTTIDTNGYILNVSGKCSILGNTACKILAFTGNGAQGVTGSNPGGAGGDPSVAHTVDNGSGGGTGGAVIGGGTGIAGADETNSLGGSGGHGGEGNGSAGGAGGTATAPTDDLGNVRDYPSRATSVLISRLGSTGITGGAGGGGGGLGLAATTGGGGAAGGGIVCANIHEFYSEQTSTTVFDAKGGTGGDETISGGNKSGAGGGGGGGAVLLNVGSYTIPSGSLSTWCSVAGGAPGAQTSPAIAATAGSAGTIVATALQDLGT